jgi:hypothetical protein
MGQLAAVFGESFENEYIAERDKQQHEDSRLDDETKEKICHKAICSGEFDGDDPRFTFQNDGVEHDVVLMESPEQNLGKFIHTYEDGGMSVGMFHLSELWSCNFDKERVDLVEQIKMDQYYLVIGECTEKATTSTRGKERIYKNISQVRDLIPLSEVHMIAEKDYPDMDT